MKVASEQFREAYRSALSGVYRFWTPAMQAEIARHCRGWAVGSFDFEPHLRAHFEYMAIANPIVASDLGPDRLGGARMRSLHAAAPEGLEGAVRVALLVEPGSVESLIAGLRQVLDLPEAGRQALGACARRLVLESFTWDGNVDAVVERL